MAYARVVNMEYKSTEHMKNYSWERSNQHDYMGLPDALSGAVISTGPNSTMLTAVYKSEQLAEQARVITNQFYEGTSYFHEIIYFHGEVIHKKYLIMASQLYYLARSKHPPNQTAPNTAPSV